MVIKTAHLRTFLSMLLLFVGPYILAQKIYLGSGAKVGEISDTTAIVHARLTLTPGQDTNGYIQGTSGSFRIKYAENPKFKNALNTPWVSVAAEADYSAQIKLSDLQSDTRYHYQVELKKSAGTPSYTSKLFSFTTAPKPTVRKPLSFQVTSCQDLKGDSTYYYMAQQKPSFLVSTGDNVYYDSDDAPVKARTVALAYKFYQQMYGQKFIKEYFTDIGGYFQKDDHDYRFNDADPCQTFKGLGWRICDGGNAYKESTMAFPPRRH